MRALTSARSSSGIGLELFLQRAVTASPSIGDSQLSPPHLLQDRAARRAGRRSGLRSPAMSRSWLNRQIGRISPESFPRWGCGGLRPPQARAGSRRAESPYRVARFQQAGLQVHLAGVVACPCRRKEGLRKYLQRRKRRLPPLPLGREMWAWLADP